MSEDTKQAPEATEQQKTAPAADQAKENNSSTSTSAPKSEKTEAKEDGWLASHWKSFVAISILILVILFGGSGISTVSYNTGYTRGYTAAVTDYESAPWYSRWWSGLTGNFPGKK